MKLAVKIHKRLNNFSLDTEFETHDIITGFLGASGCGKSMTLRCIAGIETPDSGHIELDGRVLYDSNSKINIAPQDRHIGYLFQNYALFPTMNVKKNILYGMSQINSKKEKEEKLSNAISIFNLEGLESHMPYQLSGGQAQRVALARMLVSDPELLMFDEPFSALDSFLRKNIQEELLSFIKSIGKQAILVTHSQKEIRKMCTKLYIMKNGRIIRCGETEEVFNNPGSRDCEVLLEEY